MNDPIINIRKSKSIFFKFLISYISILLVSASIGVILYFKAGRVVQEEANRYNDAMLKQVRQAVDSQLRDMQQLAIQAAYDKPIRDYASLGPEKHNDVSRLLKSIYDYKKRSNFIYDMYVYLKSDDQIISPSGCWKPDFFYNNFYKYKDTDFSEWHTYLNNFIGGADYIPLQAVYVGIDKWISNMITYVYPLRSMAGNYIGCMVILIDEKQIYNLLKNMEIVTNGTLYVVDSKNRLIASSTTNYDLPISLNIPEIPFADMLSDENNLIYKKINNRDMVISYTLSQVNGWKYISVVPTSVYLEKVENIKNFILMIVVISLIVGIFLAYLLAYKNYNPIKELINTLMVRIGRTSRGLANNEYDYIKQVVVSTIDENKKIIDMLDKQRPLLRFNFLFRLLQGNALNNGSIADSLDFFDVKFISNKFAVMVFNIDSGGKYIKTGSEQEWAYVRLIAANAADQAGNEHNKAYVVEIDYRQFAMIINFDANTNIDTVTLMESISCRLKQQLMNEFGFILTIGIGNMYTGIDNITRSFKEALIALNYKIAKGCNSVICYRDVQENNENYYYPVEIEAKLINCIKAGQFNEVKTVINDIFRENFEKRHLSYKLMLCLFFDIMSTAIKTFSEIKIDYIDVFGTGFDPVEQILECQTAEEMHKTIINIYDRVCTYIVNNRRSRNTELKDRIISYIDTHYDNPNLSVAFIAEKMEINPSYLSYFFKEQTGQNLTDYINTVRLKRAEALLEDKNLTINKIAEMVGYGAANTFIRIFKKDRGVTPGEYRKKFGF